MFKERRTKQTNNIFSNFKQKKKALN